MPKDLASRIAFFYCASALSGAFSGLLAAGIAQMDGVGGYEGWRCEYNDDEIGGQANKQQGYFSLRVYSPF